MRIHALAVEESLTNLNTSADGRSVGEATHVGIAMGVNGTDVTKAAADLILLDDNFASIVAAIEEGRAVFDNIRKFLTYILSSSILEIVPYLAFVLLRIPLPLTIIQILAVGMGTDMLPALALGERRLSWAPVARADLFLGVLEAAAAMAGGFTGNRLLQLGITSELAVILLILGTPAGNRLVGTPPIDRSPWLLAAACALLMWALEEPHKAFVRRTPRN